MITLGDVDYYVADKKVYVFKYNINEEELLMNIISKYEKVTFHGDFNMPINNLPINLTELTIISDKFQQNVDYLPYGLLKLRLDFTDIANRTYYYYPFDNLPPTLKDFTLRITKLNMGMNKGINNLPYDLHTFDLSIYKLETDDIINLPCNLHTLQLRSSNSLQVPIKNLPKNLKMLFIHMHLITSDIELPDGLEILTLLDCKYNMYYEALKAKYPNVKIESIL